MHEYKNKNFSSELVISEEVIAAISANAAKDVEGVTGLSPRPVDINTAFKIGAENLKYVAVVISDFDIKVHVYVTLSSTAKIKTVCGNVQNAVKAAIQNMTGKVVTRVDVTVAGISDEVEDDKSAEHVSLES